MSAADPVSGAAPAAVIPEDDRRALLRLVRETLERYFAAGLVPERPPLTPALDAPRATFVTLRRRGTGELRGCVGETRPRGPLVESVMRMAIAAATEDPRFPAVTAEELPSLQIEISALTPMAPIRPEDVVVGRHGLLITRGAATGLLLTQVPTAHGWNRTQFLAALCRKAGLPDDAWLSDDVRLFAFESEVWEEKDDRESASEPPPL
jgi:AmmeMemoRadiSam system protein A